MEHDQHLGDSAEDRRRRVLEAATACLRKEKEELEKSCGTSTQGGFHEVGFC